MQSFYTHWYSQLRQEDCWKFTGYSLGQQRKSCLKQTTVATVTVLEFLCGGVHLCSELRQEDCWKFKASLGASLDCREDPGSNKQQQQSKAKFLCSQGSHGVLNVGTVGFSLPEVSGNLSTFSRQEGGLGVNSGTVIVGFSCQTCEGNLS